MGGKSFFYVNPLDVYSKNHTNPVLEQVKVEMKCDLLKAQDIEIKISGSDLENKNVALRVPSWSSGYSVKISNNEAEYEIIDRYREIDNDDSLYHENNITLENEKITLVPYHYWGNRGIGEMQVWFRIK